MIHGRASKAMRLAGSPHLPDASHPRHAANTVIMPVQSAMTLQPGSSNSHTLSNKSGIDTTDGWARRPPAADYTHAQALLRSGPRPGG
jgi:hypothetical protein